MWNALNTLGNFKPESIRLDFEMSVANSIQNVYGEDTLIWFCLFHLSQSCLRKLFEQHKGRYQDPNEKTFATRCRMIVALAFIPVDEVVQVFEEFIAFDKNHPKTPNLLPQEYVLYFERNYIGKPVRRKERQTPR